MYENKKKKEKSNTLGSFANISNNSQKQKTSNPSFLINSNVSNLAKPPILKDNTFNENSFERDSSCEKRSVSVKKKKKQSNLGNLNIKNNITLKEKEIIKTEREDSYQQKIDKQIIERDHSVHSKKSQKKVKQNNLINLARQNEKQIKNNPINKGGLEEFTSQRYTQTSKNKSEKRKVKQASLKQLVKQKKNTLPVTREYNKDVQVIRKNEEKNDLNKYQYAQQSAVVNVRVQDESKQLKSHQRKNIFKQKQSVQLSHNNKINYTNNYNADVKPRKPQNTVGYLFQQNKNKKQDDNSKISQFDPKVRQRKKLGALLKQSRQKNQDSKFTNTIKQNDSFERSQLSKIQSSRFAGSKSNIKFIPIEKKQPLNDDVYFQSQLEQSKINREKVEEKKQPQIKKEPQIKIQRNNIFDNQNHLKNSILKYSQSPSHSIDSDENKKNLKQQSLFFQFEKSKAQQKPEKKRKGLNVTSKQNSLNKIKNSPGSGSGNQKKIQDLSEVQSQHSNKSKKKKVKESTLQFLKKSNNQKYFDFKVQNSPNKINDSFYQDQQIIPPKKQYIPQIPKVIMFQDDPPLKRNTNTNFNIQPKVLIQKQPSKTTDNFYQKSSIYEPSLTSSKHPLSKPPTNKSKKSIDSKKSMKSSKQSSLSDFGNFHKNNGKIEIQNKIETKLNKQTPLTLNDIAKMKQKQNKSNNNNNLNLSYRDSNYEQNRSKRSISKKKQSNLKDYFMKSNSSGVDSSDKSYDSKNSYQSKKSNKIVKESSLTNLNNRQQKQKQSSPQRMIKRNVYHINKNGSLVKQDVYIKNTNNKPKIIQPQYYQTQYSNNDYSYKFSQTNLSMRSKSKKSQSRKSKNNKIKKNKEESTEKKLLEESQVQKIPISNQISTLDEFIKPVQYNIPKKNANTLEDYYLAQNSTQNKYYYQQQQPVKLSYNQMFERKKMVPQKKKMRRTQR